MGKREPAASPPGEPEPEHADETTLAEDEWPVAPLYQVTPDAPPEDRLREEHGATAGATTRGRWPGRPRRGPLLLSVLGLALLSGAAAAVLATAFDDAVGGQSIASPSTPGGPAQPGASPPTTDPTSSETTAKETNTEAAATVATVSVPSAVGLRASVAVRRIRAAELSPSTRVVSSARPTGTVVAQRPSPGTRLERGEVVELRVAKRPQPTTLGMPQLEGLSAATAKSRLRALGLDWTVVERSSDEAAGTVVGQTPSAGATVRKGATVTLRISSGPASVTVPDVTGLEEAAARAELQSAGFEVSVLDQPTTDPTQADRVISQDPVGDSDAEKGSLVTITVARLS